MRRYELMLLFRPDLEDDKLQAAVEKVTRAIVNAGGSLSKVSPWGKRRLAYEIQRHREASYFLIHFDIEPAQVRGVERGLLISEEILRHLVTVLEDRGPAPEEIPAAGAAQDGRAADDVGMATAPSSESDGATATAVREPEASPTAREPAGEGAIDDGTAADVPQPDEEHAEA